jgi:hypothetical protein
MAAKVVIIREYCCTSAKLRVVDNTRLQITTGLPLQSREKSVMFVKNVVTANNSQ